MKKILIAGLIGIGILTSGYAYMNHTDKPKYQIRKDYTVKYGDTVWGIAEKNVQKGEDIRQYIYNLEQINGARLHDLRPGDKIEIYKY